jgi:hypothetical protein
MSIVLLGSTSGSCTLQEQAVAGTTVLTLPTTSGTVLTTVSTDTANSLNAGLGVNQTWTQFTSGTRVSGTTYTNNTGKPIVVALGASGTSSGVNIVIDGVTVASQANGAVSSFNNSASAIVPNGSTYTCTYTPTFLFWSELR